MEFPLTTTSQRIWNVLPYLDFKAKILQITGEEEPSSNVITFAQVVAGVGIKDGLLCCKAEPQYSAHWSKFSVWCLREAGLLSDESCTNSMGDLSPSTAAYIFSKRAAESKAIKLGKYDFSVWSDTLRKMEILQKEAFLELVKFGTLPKHR